MMQVLPDNFELSGDRVRLIPLNSEDAPLFVEWLSDPEAVKYSLSRFLDPMSKKEVDNWLAQVIADSSALSLGIERKDEGRLIGYAGVAAMSKRNFNGEYFIFIGDKTSWGNGFGTEVTKIITDYAFEKLGLHRLQLTVSEPNVGGIKAYKRAGFVTEGVLRDACWRDSKPHNKIIMSILKNEWAARKNATKR